MDQCLLEPIVLPASLEEHQRHREATESRCAAAAAIHFWQRYSAFIREFLFSHPIAAPVWAAAAARNGDCPRIVEGRSAADAERGLLPQSRKCPK